MPAHPAYPPDRVWLELADKSGRAGHVRAEMIGLLTAAGYARSLEPTLAKHPLLIHTARGHWQIQARSVAATGDRSGLVST